MNKDVAPAHQVVFFCEFLVESVEESRWAPTSAGLPDERAARDHLRDLRENYPRQEFRLVRICSSREVVG